VSDATLARFNQICKMKPEPGTTCRSLQGLVALADGGIAEKMHVQRLKDSLANKTLKWEAIKEKRDGPDTKGPGSCSKNSQTAPVELARIRALKTCTLYPGAFRSGKDIAS
jgi:hypothetical protein